MKISGAGVRSGRAGLNDVASVGLEAEVVMSRWRIMVNRFLVGACGVAAFLAAQPAAAVTFEFYEGNNCTQKMIGAYNYAASGVMHNTGTDVTAALRGNNDEARSLKISTSLPRVTDVKGLNIQIYDSPSAKKDDDFVVVYIVDPQQIPAQGVCIGSFESNFDRSGVFMWRQPRNGLDGKVSSLIVQCDVCSRVYSAADQAEINRQAAAATEQQRKDEAAAKLRQQQEQAAKLAMLRRQMLTVGTIRVSPSPQVKVLKK